MKINFLPKAVAMALLTMVACSHGTDMTDNAPVTPPTTPHADTVADTTSSTRSTSKGTLTVSLLFTHGNTIASNQYAIWIEDHEGRLVRTLFVTAFTGNGGYQRRKDTCPTWVSKAKPSELSDTKVDAFTSATPSNGQHTYAWDGKDDQGHYVSAGAYKVCVEGTLYWSSRVLYQGIFTYGGKSQDLTLSPSFSSDDTTNKYMLTQVTAKYTPNK